MINVLLPIGSYFAVIFGSWLGAVEVAINLLPSIRSNIVPNDVNHSIDKVLMPIILDAAFYVQSHMN